MRILVTGANGFVGSALCRDLRDRQFAVRTAVRRPLSLDALGQSSNDVACVGEINPHTDWAPALANIDVVVYLAARVHVMQETHSDPAAEFRRVNILGS